MKIWIEGRERTEQEVREALAQGLSPAGVDYAVAILLWGEAKRLGMDSEEYERRMEECRDKAHNELISTMRS